MAVKITSKFRTIVNKHDKIAGDVEPEKLNVVESDSGSYAYLNECIADSDPNNFKGLTESKEGGTFIEPSDSTYTIDYDSALISFSESYAIPATLYAWYWGGGSVIWADDVNSLQEACNTIDNNTLYKDGSVALTGNLNANGNSIVNVNNVNGVSIRNHAHLGQDVDGTVQLGDDSISELSISKVTGLQTALNGKENKLPTYQSGKFLTNNGNAVSWGYASSRNIGEVVQSMLPLNDPKLHLLNGDLVSTTAYPDLNNYILTNSLVTQYPSGVEIVGSLQNSNHVLSGFSNSSYAKIPITFAPVDKDWEIQLKFKYAEPTATGITYQDLISPELSTSMSYPQLYITTTKYHNDNKIDYINFISYFVTSGGVQENISLSATSDSYGFNFVDNTDYWLKIGYNNSTLFLQLSYDGETFNNLATRSISGISFPIYEESFLNLGIANSLVHYFQGSIDLKECYIKIEDTVIWQGGITYNKADADFLLDEGLWHSYKYKYGVCGKFVYDYANKTIRLPKANCILQGSISDYNVGNIVEAGLPNITGNGWVQYGINGSDWAGAFKASNITGKADQASGTAVGQGTLAFNASWSNPIYGNSTTVQPQTIKALNYMVVSK